MRQTLLAPPHSTRGSGRPAETCAAHPAPSDACDAAWALAVPPAPPHPCRRCLWREAPQPGALPCRCFAAGRWAAVHPAGWSASLQAGRRTGPSARQGSAGLRRSKRARLPPKGVSHSGRAMCDSRPRLQCPQTRRRASGGGSTGAACTSRRIFDARHSRLLAACTGTRSRESNATPSAPRQAPGHCPCCS